MATAHEGPTPAGTFQQRLGLFDATMLVTGTMIGSGIFIVSAEIARDVGSAGWLMALWVFTGIMTLAGALSYAELAGMMPHAGGQYVYLREAYNPLCGFLYGWTLFLVIQTGSIAAVGVAFAKFLGVLVPVLGTDNVLFQLKGLNLKLVLPGMEQAFFQRDAFTISAGQLVAVGVVLFLTFLNCRGVQEGKWIQNIFTLAKTLALILLIVLGLTVAANPQAIAQNTKELWAGIYETKSYDDVQKLIHHQGLLAALMVAGGAMVGSLFAADAWSNVTFIAGEIRNPRRNLPLSLAVGAGSVLLLYLLANLAYLAVLPVNGDPTLTKEIDAMKKEADELRKEARQKPKNQADLEAQAARLQEKIKKKFDDASAFALGIDHARDDRVGTAALQQASPRLGVPFMALAVMISTFGCLNGMILMGARLYYAMAQDRLFFQSVGRLNRRGVPAVALILQGLWSVLLIFSGTYGELLDYVVFAVLFFYVLTVSGLFVLRRTRPDAERPYRAFGYPVVPALYVLSCFVIMLDLLVVKPVFTWPGLVIVLSGIPVYFLWRRISGSGPHSLSSC